MAFDTVPYVVDGTTVDGEVIRRALGSLIGIPGAIRSADLSVVQQASPNMSVQIGTGEIWVPGSSTPSQGPYYSKNGAPVTVAISASNPSDPRVDQVIAQVQDAAYAGSADALQPDVVIGTPTAGASLANPVGLGALPASCTVLAYVLVPAGATSITTADIENAVPQAMPALPALRTVPVAAAYTARNRDAVEVVAGSSVPVTLPAPVSHNMVAVYTSVPGTVVIASSGVILGYGLGNSSTTMLLAVPGARVILQADGGNWFVLAGGQDTGFVAITSFGTDMGLVSAGTFDSPPEARCHGDCVETRGVVLYSGGSPLASAATVCQLPAGIPSPAKAQPLTAQTDGFFYVNPSGFITFWQEQSAASPAPGAVIPIAGSYSLAP